VTCTYIVFVQCNLQISSNYGDDDDDDDDNDEQEEEQRISDNSYF
jgi:hypothetical protein